MIMICLKSLERERTKEGGTKEQKRSVPLLMLSEQSLHETETWVLDNCPRCSFWGETHIQGQASFWLAAD